MSNQQQQNQKAAQKAELTVTYEVDGGKITLTPSIVQQYIVGSENGTITLPEFKLFTELCKVRKLNPFLKEAYCIKYGNSPAQIVVGKDAVLKRAVLNPSFDGLESGVIVQNTNTGELIETGHFVKMQRLVGWAKYTARLVIDILQRSIRSLKKGQISYCIWATRRLWSGRKGRSASWTFVQISACTELRCAASEQQSYSKTGIITQLNSLPEPENELMRIIREL